MMMKRFIQLSVLSLSLLLLPFANAAKGKLTSSTFNSMVLYYGLAKVGVVNLDYFITVATPQGVNYAHYRSTLADKTHKGSKIPLVSWSGPGTAPVLTLTDFDTSESSSHCPGLSPKWVCASQTFSVTVEADNYGCPWVAALYMVSTEMTGLSISNSYTSPTVRSTICPTVPIDTYDVSWDPNVVKHDTVLSIPSTGGTVSSTLKTYLMESGSLCDKSKFDGRGAYCRFVGTGVTLTVRGCDNANVTTVASPYALDNVALHDINVTVDTKNIGTGMVKATCSFQYVLDQL